MEAGEWFDERHLAPDAAQRLAAAFLSSANRLVVVHDVLRPDVAASLAAFLAEAAAFSAEYGLYSVDEGVAPDVWEAAPTTSKTKVLSLSTAVALIDDDAHRSV